MQEIQIPNFLPHFDYLNGLLRATILKTRFSHSKIYMTGSRNGAKNYSLTDLILKQSIVGVNAIWYCIRWNYADANEWFTEILIHFHKHFLFPKFNKTDRTIKLNKLTVKFEYLSSPQAKKKGTTGKRGGRSTFHNYIFVWADEAYEIDLEKFYGTVPSYRSTKKSLIQKFTILTSNPDSRENAFIAKCIKLAEPTRRDMEVYGQLYKETKDTIIHWIRWTLNPHVHDDEIAIIKEYPPNKKDPWDLGLPGSLKGAIFTEYIDRINKPLDFTTTRFDVYTAGIDWAWGNTADAGYTTLKLNGIKLEPHLMKCGIFEYAHQNNEHGFKSGAQKINEICRHLVEHLKTFRALNKFAKISVYVDYAHEGTELINSFIRVMSNLGYDSNDINFNKCLKLGDEVEVEELQNMIWNGFVYDSPKISPRYFIELRNAYWDETTKSTIGGGFDHSFDADAYSMNNYRHLFKNKKTNYKDIDGEIWGDNSIYS